MQKRRARIEAENLVLYIEAENFNRLKENPVSATVWIAGVETNSNPPEFLEDKTRSVVTLKDLYDAAYNQYGKEIFIKTVYGRFHDGNVASYSLTPYTSSDSAVVGVIFDRYEDLHRSKHSIAEYATERFMSVLKSITLDPLDIKVTLSVQANDLQNREMPKEIVSISKVKSIFTPDDILQMIRMIPEEIVHALLSAQGSKAQEDTIIMKQGESVYKNQAILDLHNENTNLYKELLNIVIPHIGLFVSSN